MLTVMLTDEGLRKNLKLRHLLSITFTGGITRRHLTGAEYRIPQQVQLPVIRRICEVEGKVHSPQISPLSIATYDATQTLLGNRVFFITYQAPIRL